MTQKTQKNDHVEGVNDAPVELMEYADFECPYCGRAYQIVKKIQKELGKNLKFVFRNFPLTQMHPNALHAALAAEAAGAQGKFWEMHDILFENQEYLEDQYILEYAKKIGLDLAKFEKDFSKDEYYQKVKNDYESGVKEGVDGTPTFFINGKKFEGNWMSHEFIDYLKSLIK
jgi:protein-disulfide isomerase